LVLSGVGCDTLRTDVRSVTICRSEKEEVGKISFGKKKLLVGVVMVLVGIHGGYLSLSVGTAGVGFVRRWLVVRVFLVDLLVAGSLAVVLWCVSSSFISSCDAGSVLVVSCLVGSFLAGRRWRAVIVVRLIGGSTVGYRARGGGGSCGVFGVDAVVRGSRFLG
jgi:hypothetical protein